MRQLTAYASYLDNLGAPLVGRARFYNLDDSPAVVYGLDNAHQNYVPLGHIVYTNSSGQLVPQVFLDDHDYLVVFDKYIGGGTMAEDDDPDNWPEMGSAVDKYNTVGIELNGSSLRTAETISSLRSLIPTDHHTDTKEVVTLLGYNSKGDKPEINYIWNAYSNENDNGGSIVKVEGIATGRWVLVDCPRHLDVRHFGAFPNSSSDQDDIQCGRIQLAGAYAHSNNCGLYFYGDSLNAYYDISGLQLYDIDSDDDAMVFAMNGTESTLRDVINIHCATNQFTSVADQGRINLYGETLRTSFAPRYNVWFGNDSKSVRTIIDSDVQTSHLDIWDVIVEVTVDTTSHWKFYNTPIISMNHIGDGVSFYGTTRLYRSMFTDDVAFNTIHVMDDSVSCDIDDFKDDVPMWCSLVRQQSNMTFDIKGCTLDGNCNMMFASGTLTLMNAVLNGFTCYMDLMLKDSHGSLEFPSAKSLRLDGCSGGVTLTSVSQGATINSRYSRMNLTSSLTVDGVVMLGGHITSSSSSYSLTSSSFNAMDAKIYCQVVCNGPLALNGCVVARNAFGDSVLLRSCVVQDANVTAHSPYDSSTQKNVMNAEVVGNSFFGSSLFKVDTTHSSSTTYTVSMDISGNYSDHSFFDDTAFSGVTHSIDLQYFSYKGNHGGCPVESKTYVTSVPYSSAPSGDAPSDQPDNTLMTYAAYPSPMAMLFLKVSQSLNLDSIGIFRVKNMNMTPRVYVRPTCKCGHLVRNGDGTYYFVNDLPMATGQNAIRAGSISYAANFKTCIPTDDGSVALTITWTRIEWHFETDGVFVGR